MKVKAQYLYRGSYLDYENTFQRKREVSMTLHLQSAKDVTRLISRSWFQPHDSNVDLLHKVLTFHLESVILFKSKDTFSEIETTGVVLFPSSNGENQEAGTVEITLGGPEEILSSNTSSIMDLPRRSHTCSTTPFF